MEEQINKEDLEAWLEYWSKSKNPIKRFERDEDDDRQRPDRATVPRSS